MKESSWFRLYWVAVLLASQAGAIEIHRMYSYTAKANTAEIIGYDDPHSRFFATHDKGLEIVDFDPEKGMSFAGNVDFTQVFDPETDCLSVSSVALNSDEGYGAACVIPADARQTGKVVFFDTDTGEILRTVCVGYHPDMLTFNSDHSRLFTADEGEPTPFGVTPKIDQPGSLSIIHLSGLNANTIRDAEIPAETFDFSEKNLDGISLAGVRVSPAHKGREMIDLEPEHIAVQGDRVFVVLQENNAIATFNQIRKKWTALFNLGTIRETIDASDKDDAQRIDDVVRGLPQPDGIAAWTTDSGTFLITANEGDLREKFVGPGVESLRYADAVNAGRVDPMTCMKLDSIYQMKIGEDADHKTALGRLMISLLDGDTDGDGDIDEPTMFGTRSLSVWDADTGELLGDTGSGLEKAALAAGCWNESRCDMKGPEPEEVIVKMIGTAVYAFAAIERTGNVVVYDVTDPRNLRFITQISTPGAVAPESLELFKKGDDRYLVVAYEGSGLINVYRISVNEAVTPVQH